MALRENGVTRRVVGTKIIYRDSDGGGLEYSDNGGENWYFSSRTWSDVEAMHHTLEPSPAPPTPEAAERELYGETLDFEIPDEYWEMLMS